MYSSILARSFSQHEQKKLGCGAVTACLLIVLSFCTVFKPYLVPQQLVDLQLSMSVGLKMLMIRETTTSHQTANAIENVTTIITPSCALKTNNSTSQKEILPLSAQKNNNLTSQEREYEARKFLSLTNQKTKRTSQKEQIEPSEISLPSARKSGKTTQKEEPKPKISSPFAPNDTLTFPKEENVITTVQPLCNVMEKKSDFCDIKGDVRIDANASTVFLVSSEKSNLEGNSSWSLKPYARKGDSFAMRNVREWRVEVVKNHQKSPQCTHDHSVPAILFSVGGYAGNHYHGISDILIPLFLTSKQFNGEVQLLTTDRGPWWISKFRTALEKLSNYKIINIDREKETHCFASVIVGLKHHKELGINASLSQYSMNDFREFLRSTYSLKRTNAIKLSHGSGKRPRLLIVTRKGTRAFINEGEIAVMARQLGFKIVATEAESNVTKFAETVNSCDVMMGVHGAGLTNIVFLPDYAVFIQVIGLGGMEWPARVFYGWPAKDMNVRYLEYMIKEQESTLIEQYPLDHPVFRDPSSITKEGWSAFKKVYMNKQNVKLDVNRFGPTLLKALELLHQ